VAAHRPRTLMMMRMRRQALGEIDAPPVEQLATARHRHEHRRIAVLDDTDGCHSFVRHVRLASRRDRRPTARRLRHRARYRGAARPMLARMSRRSASLAAMLALLAPPAFARMPSDAPPLPPPTGMTVVDVSTAQQLA